jgi:NAD(P)-dependent dehydrogenase (short-subunit alcohol dehydrogenase family)
MRDGGRVVTIGSNAAVRTGSRGSSVYATTKVAVATMVKGIALDLAPRRITVNNIQPGVGRKYFVRSVMPPDGRRDAGRQARAPG